MLVKSARVMPAFGKTLMADLGRGELVAWALLNLGRADSDKPQVIERAKTFQGLDVQQARVPAHGLGQVRLHVPGIGDDDIIRRERIHRGAKPLPDGRNIPVTLGEFESLAGEQSVLGAGLRPRRVPDRKSPPHHLPNTHLP